MISNLKDATCKWDSKIRIVYVTVIVISHQVSRVFEKHFTELLSWSGKSAYPKYDSTQSLNLSWLFPQGHDFHLTNQDGDPWIAQLYPARFRIQTTDLALLPCWPRSTQLCNNSNNSLYIHLFVVLAKHVAINWL
jgi:hypothetical protein